MDASTEPIIAVIGFPIGGNPSQFALERALAAVKLDWRVFSFDVAPEHLGTALDGLEVLGVRGVLIGKTLAAAVGQWRPDENTDAPDYTDCLYRRQPGDPFTKFDSQHSWIESRINEHASLLQRDIEKTIVVGEIPAQALWRTKLIDATIEKMPRDPDKIEEADVIVIEQDQHGPSPLELDLWPTGDETKLVMDVSDGHPQLAEIEALNYSVISRHDRRIAMLCDCFRRWTSMEAPRDVILDAIEEYLAV